jgi:hypothetical protein
MSQHPFYWPENPEPMCQYCDRERPSWQLSDASWVCDPCMSGLRSGFEPVRGQAATARDQSARVRERYDPVRDAARIAALEAALKWVRRVHPRTTRDGSKGAIVTMTRGEFDAMRVVLGLRPLFQLNDEPQGAVSEANQVPGNSGKPPQSSNPEPK